MIKLEMYSSQESNSEMATTGHSVSESLPNNGICMGSYLGGFGENWGRFQVEDVRHGWQGDFLGAKRVAKPRIRGIPRYERTRGGGDEVLKMKRRGSND